MPDSETSAKEYWAKLGRGFDEKTLISNSAVMIGEALGVTMDHIWVLWAPVILRLVERIEALEAANKK